MKIDTPVFSFLVLSTSLLSAKQWDRWTFRESPIDGIIEFKEEVKEGTSTLHYINAGQIIRVWLETKNFCSNIVFKTTEIDATPGQISLGSSRHLLSFEKESEAEKALSQILAEMAVALGAKYSTPSVPEKKVASDDSKVRHIEETREDAHGHD